jgi:hypothetical protein
MAEAKAKYSEPIIESVVLTLSPEEAKMMIQFLGKTNSNVVGDLLPDLDMVEVRQINGALYSVYAVLNNLMFGRM